MLRLVSAGGSIEEFQWSEDEQVWPFEKASDGSTLYCKEVDFGNLPNTGNKEVSHGIDHLDSLHNFYILCDTNESSYYMVLDHAGGVNRVWCAVNPLLVTIGAASNRSHWTAKARLIYKKAS